MFGQAVAVLYTQNSEGENKGPAELPADRPTVVDLYRTTVQNCTVQALKYGRGAARPVVTAGFARTTRISITKSYLPPRLCNAHDNTDFLFSRPLCHVDRVEGGGAVWGVEKFENLNNAHSSMTVGLYGLATAC